MTVTLNLPPDVQAGLLTQAQESGLSLEAYLEQLLRERVRDAQSSRDVELNPEEWVRQFKEWTRSHAADNLPLLSDEAISRESIYQERGL